jgi:hypothetical protein
MIAFGVAPIGGGTPALLFGLLGYRLRPWIADQADQARDLSSAFQAGRQRGLARAAPFWTLLGATALAAALSLFSLAR